MHWRERLRDLSRDPWVYLLRWGLFAGEEMSLENELAKLCNVVSFHFYRSKIDVFRGKLVRKSIPPEARRYETLSKLGRVDSGILASLEKVSAHLFDKITLRSPKYVLPEEPDLIFVMELPRRIADLNTFKCPKVYYAMDSHIATRRYFTWVDTREYDHVFVGQKDSLHIFSEHGCRNTHWLPPAADADVLAGPRLEEKYDVCFAGSLYPGTPRETYLEGLKKRFALRLEKVFNRDLGRLYRSSKIAFHKTSRGDLSLRVFEAMCGGSLLICDRIGNGLFDLFREGYHMACYDSEEELYGKVGYYLENDDERREIAERGRMEVLAKHTNAHRVREVLHTCLGRSFPPPEISAQAPIIR